MKRTVYCIIPVHNRAKITKKCVAHLTAQDYEDLHIVMVDDGSTDGTSEFLANQESDHFEVLNGDGNLWWGGAMRMGIDWTLARAIESDYVLMLNDDVSIRSDYVSKLVEFSKTHSDAMVGSVFRDEETSRLVSYGSFIDYWKMTISAISSPDERNKVNALSGRGVLIPVHRALETGNLRSTFFRHYMGDFEYTARLREKGCPIVVCESAPVFASTVSSDSHIRRRGALYRYLSPRSKDNLLLRLMFFSTRGPVLLRLIAIPRYIIMALARSLRPSDPSKLSTEK